MPREFSMVTATGSVRKSLACWWGRRARMLTRIMVTILSRAAAVENTTLRANPYLDGSSGWSLQGTAFKGCGKTHSSEGYGLQSLRKNYVSPGGTAESQSCPN